jgi:hypothetical protein
MSISNTSSRRVGVNAPGLAVFLSLGCSGYTQLVLPLRQDPKTTHTSRVHGSNLKTRRIKIAYIFLQFFGCIERLVAQINVSLESEREFPMRPHSCRHLVVVEPVEYGPEWIDTTIKGPHGLWFPLFLEFTRDRPRGVPGLRKSISVDIVVQDQDATACCSPIDAFSTATYPRRFRCDYHGACLIPLSVRLHCVQDGITSLTRPSRHRSRCGRHCRHVSPSFSGLDTTS